MKVGMCSVDFVIPISYQSLAEKFPVGIKLYDVAFVQFYSSNRKYHNYFSVSEEDAIMLSLSGDYITCNSDEIRIIDYIADIEQLNVMAKAHGILIKSWWKVGMCTVDFATDRKYISLSKLLPVGISLYDVGYAIRVDNGKYVIYFEVDEEDSVFLALNDFQLCDSKEIIRISMSWSVVESYNKVFQENGVLVKSWHEYG
jgi:hypothetical protein